MNLPFAVLEKSKLSFASVALLFAVASTVGALQGVAATPPAIRAISGVNQQTPYASAFSKPLVVWVSDPATGLSLSGVRVNFSPSSGIRLNTASAVTDDLGLASVAAVGLAVGDANVRATVDGFPNAAADFALVVSKAVITIVPADLQSDVGVIPAITDYTLRGFVNGDTEDTAEVSGTPVLTTTATPNSPDANYAIKGGVGSMYSPKYDFVPGFGTLVLRGTAASGNRNASRRNDDVIIPASTESPNEVRRALLNQSTVGSQNQPSLVISNHPVSSENVQAAIQPAAFKPAGSASEMGRARVSPSAALPQIQSAAASSNHRASGESVRAAIETKSLAHPSAPAHNAATVVHIGLTPPGSK